MTVDRCDLSDLPVEMCDHCKQGATTLGDRPQPHDAEPVDSIRFYRKSDRPGRCVCGEPFATGDQIGWDEDAGWWRAENCCG